MQYRNLKLSVAMGFDGDQLFDLGLQDQECRAVKLTSDGFTLGCRQRRVTEI